MLRLLPTTFACKVMQPPIDHVQLFHSSFCSLIFCMCIGHDRSSLGIESRGHISDVRLSKKEMLLV